MTLSTNSRCLAYHGPLLYEAKVLRVYDPKTRTAKAKAPQSEGAGEKVVSTGDLPEELKDKTAYFVHYKGWKQAWDEWVDPDRVLAWNEENIRKQKELKQNILATMQKSKSKTISTGPGSGDIVLAGHHHNVEKETKKRKEPPKDDENSNGKAAQPTRKRRATGNHSSSTATTATSTSAAAAAASTTGTATSNGAASTNNGGSNNSPSEPAVGLEGEDEYRRRPEIVIEIPHLLRAQLVDDWEKVTKNRKLVKLPATLNVNDILTKYRKEAPLKKDSEIEAGIFDEVLSGLKLYFDRALGKILLYRFERQQYLEIKKKNPDKNASQLYGGEHLLRLLTSLPGLIAQTHMDEQGITHLREHIERFLRFLVQKRNEIFLDEYEETSSRYEALAKGV